MIKRKLLLAALVLGALGLFVSCHQEQDVNCPYGFKEGIIVFTGAPEVDGCGWMISFDSPDNGVTYHPVNLDKDYQVNGLNVLVKYTADPEEFRCGRGGATYPSIRITEIKMNAPAVGILHDNEWDKYSMDAFRLDSAFVKDDNLLMRVSYSGGCRDHEFNLWRLPTNALDPPPIELALSHNSNGDLCEAWITRWLVFSLVPLREKNKHEVKFLLRGSPEMSAYFGTFTYGY
ncbi:MAG: hypothetical protein WCW62_11365 [Bacteroidales bacterium]